MWFLWEDGAFWWLTGGWSGLPATLKADPSVALVIDTCDLATGEVLQLSAEGEERSTNSTPGGPAAYCAATSAPTNPAGPSASGAARSTIRPRG